MVSCDGSFVTTDEGRQHWLVYKLENQEELQRTVLSDLNESATCLLVQPTVVTLSPQRSLLSPQSGSFLDILS